MERTPEQLQADLTDALWQIEVLTEAAVDAERVLARDDLGWSPFGQDALSGPWSVEQVRDTAGKAAVAALVDPLVRRGLGILRTYCWSGGVQITARQDDTDAQDVSAVVDAFLTDQVTTFTGAQARHEQFDVLATSGNLFYALPTNPVTGRVQVRTIPLPQVTEIVTDPEDAATPWLYKRVYTVRTVGLQTDGTGAQTTTTVSETRTTWHPALGFRPRRRPRTIDGHQIDWDTPVLHVAVNRPEGSLWGTSDLLAALPWARGYRDFLIDWARLVKALSKLAFKTTGTRGSKAGQVRDAITAGTDVGGTAILGPGQDLVAIGKSGATIDSGSGRPLAAQVAAALSVPVTMILSDPGVTGARATAETLDRPLTETIGARREVLTAVHRRILDHVIDAAIRAPRGPLSGTVTINPDTGAETVTLAGDQARTVDLDWPDLEGLPLNELVAAIKTADDTGKMPPATVARLLLNALDVENADELVSEMLDDDGNWVDPDVSAAMDAVRRGDWPTNTNPGDDG